MKVFFKILLKYYLKYLTKLVLFIHRPTIIVVAGSMNKHFIKQEIKKTLQENKYSVRANPKNFNTEIGLPLAVLGLSSGYNSYYKWLPVIFQAFKSIFLTKFPQFLVLSLGSSDPGDMKYLLKIIKPKIAIISDITQRYSENFDNVEQLLEEYLALIKKLKNSHTLVLNNDDIKLKTLKNKTKSKLITFGFSESADCSAKIIKRGVYGQKIKIDYKNKELDFDIKKFGKHHVYAKMIGVIILSCIKK